MGTFEYFHELIHNQNIDELEERKGYALTKRAMCNCPHRKVELNELESILRKETTKAAIVT